MVNHGHAVIVTTLQAGCSSSQSPQDQITSPVSAILFYEYWGFRGYQTKTVIIENGIVNESVEEWERGYAKAIPVGPAEELARKLNFNDYTELQLAYGQLYHYKNYPFGKVYTFYGIYNGTNDYTIMIWNDSGVHKIALPDSDFLFEDLQYNENHLYLILSEYPEEMDDQEGCIFVYEIELNSFNPTKYTLTNKRDILWECENVLITKKKLYLVDNVNITHTTADANLVVIDCYC